MLRQFLVSLMMISALGADAQFKNDNVLYKTVYPAELCTSLQKEKEFLLLDVRTPGEFADTSASPSYNLGHLRNALNIPVGNLGNRLSEIAYYKYKPVYVYCSHSQRSRRACKMLADSGFTNIININGGITSFHYADVAETGCLKNLLQTSIPYKIISFTGLCNLVGQKEPPLIIDVRPDSAFRHITPDAKINAMGTIRGAVNIPLNEILAGNSRQLSGHGTIILVDQYGDEAARAATYLASKGYSNLYVLIEGADRVIYSGWKGTACGEKLFITPVTYPVYNVSEFAAHIKQANDYILLDVRSADEFSNKHKDYWRNIGHLSGAINIPVTEIAARYAELDKRKEIIIYSFSSGKDIFDAANQLKELGYTKLSVIYGGIFNMRWAAGNVKGQEHLKDMVVDIPEINQ